MLCVNVDFSNRNEATKISSLVYPVLHILGVQEAKGALDRFKFEVASELGVPLTDGYNGNLTSKQNGSVGGYMVKKMIENQERQMSGNGQMGGTSQMGGSSQMSSGMQQ